MRHLHSLFKITEKNPILYGCYFILFIPKTRKSFIITTSVSIISTVLIITVLAGSGSQEFAMFITIKSFTIFLSIFLLKYNSCESRGIFEMPKESVFTTSFRILWFYLAGIMVFRSFYFPFYEENKNIIQTISDSTVFIISMLTSFWFLRHRNKVLTVRNDTVNFSGKNIDDALSPVNLEIFKYLIKAPGQKLTCSSLTLLLYPEESDICKASCKPSICPVCQRIYKRIRKIRKAVELLEIRTIISPDKNSNVKLEGWKLLIYNDIEVK